MSLIVEDGTGLADAESYISVAEADTYHSIRGNTTWATLLVAEKEQALRRAMDYLSQAYGDRWLGERHTLTQAQDWPRSGMRFRGRSLVTGEIPESLKNAVAELAWRAAAKVELLADVTPEDRIKREKIGPLETEYEGNGLTRTKYHVIDALLRSFITSLGGGVNVRLKRT